MKHFCFGGPRLAAIANFSHCDLYPVVFVSITSLAIQLNTDIFAHFMTRTQLITPASRTLEYEFEAATLSWS